MDQESDKQNDNVVAIGLLTRTHMRMLGSSLKVVFRVDDTDRFDELLQALDEADRARSPKPRVSS
jgi:hypothetical protein